MEDDFVTYVLYSKKFDKIYIGFTSNLIERIKSHNYLGKKGYTLRYRPWIVVLVTFFKSKKEAILHEKSLKSGQGRQYIHKQVLQNFK